MFMMKRMMFIKKKSKLIFDETVSSIRESAKYMDLQKSEI